MPVATCTQKIVYVEFWLAEKARRALIFEDQQPALDRADIAGGATKILSTSQMGDAILAELQTAI